jgi:hypothetical protein
MFPSTRTDNNLTVETPLRTQLRTAAPSRHSRGYGEDCLVGSFLIPHRSAFEGSDSPPLDHAQGRRR